MVPAILAVDIDGEPLRRAILQNDARATVEIDEVRTTLGDFDLLARTGSVLTSSPLPPRRSGSRDTNPRCGKGCLSAGFLRLDGSRPRRGAARRVQLGDREWTLRFRRVPLDAVQSATPVTWPKMLDVARPARSSASSACRPPRRRACGRDDDRRRWRRSRTFSVRCRTRQSG